MNLDASGFNGLLLHYAGTIFYVVGAFLIFLYLWKQQRLDMDEGPKMEMMRDDHE